MFQETIIEITESTDLKTLQCLAAVRVAISVCETEDLQYMIGRFRKTNGNKSTVGFSDDQWRRLNGKVKRKLDQIGVPDLIIDTVTENLWPISFEIYKWIRYHVEDTGIDWSPNFYWTPRANIDYVKTAESLTKSEALDLKKRFKLACIHCLDSEVRSLWDQMSLSERRSFFLRGNLKNSDQNLIILYWTYCIQEVPIKNWGSRLLYDSNLFKYAMKNGYLSATKFFWGKLKIRYKETVISNDFYGHLFKLDNPELIAKDHLAVACFLICQLRPDNQDIYHFLMINLIFRYFLEWPWQKHFMIVVNRLRSHIGPGIFIDLLNAIFKKDLGGFKDFDYRDLFMEFWRQSPLQYKTIVSTESEFGGSIFMKFVKKNFAFVFDENSSAMKAKFRAIVFQQETSENEIYLEKGNVDFFKFLVSEHVTSKSSIEKLTHLHIIPSQNCKTYRLDLPLGELFYLIDGILEIEQSHSTT